ncbi:MAG: TRCF domain-containing protein, partial [Chloroflexota bacterium]
EELQDRFGALPPAVLGLLYQIDVKILALTAGATAVQHRDEFVRIRLPYLPNIDRKALAQTLGDNIKVTRTAVEMPLYKEDMGAWQGNLLALLEKLALGVEEGVMA